MNIEYRSLSKKMLNELTVNLGKKGLFARRKVFTSGHKLTLRVEKEKRHQVKRSLSREPL